VIASQQKRLPSSTHGIDNPIIDILVDSPAQIPIPEKEYLGKQVKNQTLIYNQLAFH